MLAGHGPDLPEQPPGPLPGRPRPRRAARGARSPAWRCAAPPAPVIGALAVLDVVALPRGPDAGPRPARAFRRPRRRRDRAPPHQRRLAAGRGAAAPGDRPGAQLHLRQRPRRPLRPGQQSGGPRLRRPFGRGPDRPHRRPAGDPQEADRALAAGRPPQIRERARSSRSPKSR